MDTNELLALLVRHRDDLRQWLDDEQYRHFLAMLERLREAGADAERAAMAVMGIVRSLWPVPDEAGDLARILHFYDRGAAAPAAAPSQDAVLAALEALYAAPAAPAARVAQAGDAGERGGPPPDPQPADPPADPPVDADTSADADPSADADTGPAGRTGSAEATGSDEGTDPVAAVIAGARRRLLAEPSREAAVSGTPAAGVGPADVIVLADPEAGRRSPEVQFDPATGRPRDIVVRINRILLADRDPWGAADWWLGGNSWLGGAPAALLGRVPDDRLADAALALVEEGVR